MDIKEDFEDVLHKKLSKRSKSKNSEIQLLVNAFRFYDLDDKGIINKEDFSKVFGRIGLNGYSQNHLYQIFDIYDVNGVGYLDYINLIEYLYGLSTFQPLTQSSISNNQIQSNVNTNNYMNHNNNGISYQEQILGMRNQNYNQIYNQYFNQNVNNDYQNIERNYNQNYNQSLNQNYNQKIEDNLNYNQNINQSYNQNINQSYNQNINQSYNQNINQNYNQNINQNYNQNINQRYNQNLNNNLRYFQQIGQQIQTPIPQINNLYKSQQITSNIQPQIQFQNPLNQSQFFKSTTPINLSNNYINRNNNLNNNYNHSENGKILNQKSLMIKNNIFPTDNNSYNNLIKKDSYKKNDYNIITHVSNLNKEKKEEEQATRIKYYFKNILQIFQNKININDGITFYSLVSKINDNQDYIYKTLSFENFKSSLKEANIIIDVNLIKYFFNILDTKNLNKVSSEEILRLIRGNLNEKRKLCLIDKFSKIDIDKKGYCEISLLKSLFNPNYHPEVLKGKKRESEIYNEFIFTLNTYIKYKGKINQFTYEDFIEFYSGISASFEDDNSFIDVINAVWDFKNNSYLKKIEGNNDLLNGDLNLNVNQSKNSLNNDNNNNFTLDNNFNLVENNNISNNNNYLGDNNIIKKFNKRDLLNKYYKNINRTPNRKYNILTGYLEDEKNIFINESNNESNRINFPNKINDNFYLLNNLRKDLISKGPKSIFVLEKMLTMYDNDKTGKINLENLNKIFDTYKISLSNQEIEKIFNYLNPDNSNLIKYDNLISSITGTLNNKRENLIKKVHNLISINNTSKIPLLNIIKNYIFSRHPKVISGEKSPDEIYEDFNDNLQIFKEYLNSIKNISNDDLSYDDFIKFYSQISMYINDNVYFDNLINNVWNLDGNDTNHFYNFGKKFGRKYRIKSAIDFKNKIF